MTMAVNQQQMSSSRYIGALLAVGVGLPIPILGAFATLLGYFALSALSELGFCSGFWIPAELSYWSTETADQ
jgi:hypothetical protein